jgi:extracellular matrix regulatory protein A
MNTAERGPAMSLTLVNVGYDNFAVADRIIAIVGCTSAPVRRLIQECRQNGRLLDATQGRRMRSVVLMDTGHILMSALTPETLARRAAASRPLDGEGEEPVDE